LTLEELKVSQAFPLTIRRKKRRKMERKKKKKKNRIDWEEIGLT
jgi:hypothetical protein